MKLIIVESPTKSKTISQFVGNGFLVKSSYGHVRDLPKAELGIDVENNFKPKYVIPTRARKRITELKKSAQKSETVILATDEDREGEAIAWHLTQALGLNEQRAQKNVQRIVFHEITKSAIENALKNPREINQNLVDAQQARRILDRLVGYKLSPFLWKKISRGLSAGRVQSVAVRLVVEREKEIESFKPQEYWTITARLSKKTDKVLPKLSVKEDKVQFDSQLVKINGKTLDKFGIKTEKEAKQILANLEGTQYLVEKIEKKETFKHPAPPFITSTLQQETARKLRFSAKQTMVIAQQLYEGIELNDKNRIGLITYMRTDSTNLSRESVSTARDFIEKNFGKDYVPENPNIYKKKSRLAQEAHEAIRPTDPRRTPDSIKSKLEPNQYKLYNLIWRRFVASQMTSAIFDSIAVDIKAGSHIFQTRGQTLRFDGFLKVYPIKFEEIDLPILEENENLKLVKLGPNQHFTKPPPRYSEASLIKTLEKNGIGRPSTYAPIISTIQDRNYAQKDRSRYFHPTEIGTVVNDMLVKHFSDIVDINFTSQMEEELDKIAEGEKKWGPAIEEFYVPFAKNLEQKYKEVSKEDTIEETDEICEKCGKKMIIRMGRFGKFIACSGFPDCKNTKSINKDTENQKQTNVSNDKSQTEHQPDSKKSD